MQIMTLPSHPLREGGMWELLSYIIFFSFLHFSKSIMARLQEKAPFIEKKKKPEEKIFLIHFAALIALGLVIMYYRKFMKSEAKQRKQNRGGISMFFNLFP